MQDYKKKKKNRKKAKKRLPISVYVIYLLVATFMFTGISFSKYVSTTNKDADARIAVLASGISVAQIQIEGYPGAEDSVGTIVMSNYESVNGQKQISEVALACELKAENITENLPLEFTFYKDANLTQEVGIDESILFVPNVEEEKTFYLKASWPADVNDDSLAFEIDAIRIIASAQQVD